MTSEQDSGSKANVASSSDRVQAALSAVETASQHKLITEGAVYNLIRWLTEDRYRAYLESTLQHVEKQQWQKLDDVFWTIIPFGTGGRRGRMYEIGSNAINDRTIGESAQGLATYVRDYHSGAIAGVTPVAGKKESLSCVIAYDTRHRSRHFTELCAGIMVANGFHVYLLDDYRATPQLSFAVRELRCDCGIMVTASHNPPSDNAVKVYWSTGAQVLPPHDQAIIDRVMTCEEIQVAPFGEALAAGHIEIVTDRIDSGYLDAVAKCCTPGPRDIRILYTPLHGVGEAAVLPLLQRDGFKYVDVYGPHRERSGDFPNVPGHVSNPENTAVFTAPIETARTQGYDLVLATDPDCDRLGVAAPLTLDASGQWATFSGNQIAALLCHYVLGQKSAAGLLTDRSYVIKTLVTTELVRRIATAHHVRCVGDLLVGYKYIAEAMDREGPDDFMYGCEESHGYLVGQHARDKDGAVACMLMSEMAAELKARGKSLHDAMGDLYRQHGLHRESQINLFMEGSEGMAAMKSLMRAFRTSPPKSLGGIEIQQVRDYQNGTVTRMSGGTVEPLAGPRGDLVIMDLAVEGNYIAVRPSGTEPKVKFYVFTRVSPSTTENFAAADQELNQLALSIEKDVREFARVSV